MLYDAALKDLIETRPADWLPLLGLPVGPVTLVDADLVTVSAEADKVIRVAEDVLQPVVRPVGERLKAEMQRAELQKSEADKLWNAAYILSGLRLAEAVADQLFQGVIVMEESTTYQAILRKGERKGLAEGEAKEARRLVFIIGERKFGPPDPATRAAIDAMTDVARLEELAARLAVAESWAEALAAP
jgi:predicted transposase YdaD